MIKHIIATLLVITVAAAGYVGASETRDAMLSSYSEIVNLFTNQSFDLLSRFESESIKCGFGPLEEGPGCIQTLVSNNPECLGKIVFALEQGCKIQEANDAYQCYAPPQSLDEDTLLPGGARAIFTYDASVSRLVIDSLICSGD